MKFYHLIIFDADGTLRDTVDPETGAMIVGRPPNSIHEQRARVAMGGRIGAFARRQFSLCGTYPYFGVASNQAGVARGDVGPVVARQLLVFMVHSIFEPWQQVTIRMCPHDVGAGCVCRKPQPGMLLDIMREYRVLAEHTLFVGDMDTDKQAADRVGCDYLDVGAFIQGEW